MIKWLKQIFCFHVFKIMVSGDTNQRFRECRKCGCIKDYPPLARCAGQPNTSDLHTWIEAGDWFEDTHYHKCINCGRTKTIIK